MPTRIRKVRKLRGSRTHGYGQIGQHRHSGKQGGHGNAGLHKHKWSWMVINDPDHFSKDQYDVHNRNRISRWLNVGELDGMQTKTSEGAISVDLTSMGVEKLLGSGDVKRAYNIKVESFTERAKTKVEEAGGKIVE
ncbi:MAG: uL15 family ribosomal protein [Nitrososphaerota archaeon]|jgi:large subunit ribosomal protein L15|nr:uL15 family ribosomal protein [Nitrososphaerota archaeon]